MLEKSVELQSGPFYPPPSLISLSMGFWAVLGNTEECGGLQVSKAPIMRV